MWRERKFIDTGKKIRGIQIYCAIEEERNKNQIAEEREEENVDKLKNYEKEHTQNGVNEKVKKRDERYCKKEQEKNNFTWAHLIGRETDDNDEKEKLKSWWDVKIIWEGNR